MSRRQRLYLAYVCPRLKQFLRRLRSPAVWAALFALYLAYCGPGCPVQVGKTLDALLLLLAAVGFLIPDVREPADKRRRHRAVMKLANQRNRHAPPGG